MGETRRWRLHGRRIATAGVLAGALARAAAAQDLEPRAYAASPIGMTFLVAGVGRSSGEVLVDPSLPLEDVHATLGIGTVGIGQTFSLFSRTALVAGAMPYARLHATGRIQEAAREATRTGWADARVRLAVNLFGGQAMSPREFAKSRRSTIVGVSLTSVIPTGQYTSTRLVNLGSNRWAFKPEAGVSLPLGRWHLEGYAGVWLFGANGAFYPGDARRAQDRIVSIQSHASYTIRPRLWAAVDATWYSGGTTTVNGIRGTDLQRNSRVGAAASIPVGRNQSFKVTCSKGATTRIGGDFTTIALAWQMTWLR